MQNGGAKKGGPATGGKAQAGRSSDPNEVSNDQEGGNFGELDYNYSSLHEELPGKLKMNDVRQLSDDADQVIDQLKNVDLGI